MRTREKTSFWEVLASYPEGEEACYKKIIARFDRAQNAKVFQEMKSVARPEYTFEIRMVQRSRL